MVVFDSHVPINTGQAVYMSGLAELVAEADLDQVWTSSPADPSHGGREWGR